jgi:hypothetical protein
MHARTLKVTCVVTDFEQYLDSETIGKKTFPVTIEAGGVKLTANLNSKSVRKSQAAFRECGGEAAVVISGELDFAAKVINSAGIVVQPKIPKPAAPQGEDSLDQEPAAPEPAAQEAVQPAPAPPLVIVKKRRTIEVPE